MLVEPAHLVSQGGLVQGVEGEVVVVQEQEQMEMVLPQHLQKILVVVPAPVNKMDILLRQVEPMGELVVMIMRLVLMVVVFTEIMVELYHQVAGEAVGIKTPALIMAVQVEQGKFQLPTPGLYSSLTGPLQYPQA
jgi:hypothetical protein